MGDNPARIETASRTCSPSYNCADDDSYFGAEPTGELSPSIEDEIAGELAAANVAVYPIELTTTQDSKSSPQYFNNRVQYAKI